MYVSLDREQTDTLREVLQAALKQVRIESSRADSHDYREMLHHREDLLGEVLSKIAPEQLPS